MFLNKDSILAADDRPIQFVEVPEWGGTIGLRTLNVHEVNQLLLARPKLDGLSFLPFFLSLVACDGSGNRIFGSEDAELLHGKSPRVVKRLCDLGEKLNMLDDDAGERAAKNS